MIEFAGRGVLLDVEGTTSSVAYVYDVLFPFAQTHVADYLERHWDEPALRQACEQLARDVGAESLSREEVQSQALRLMADDVKATGLKALQGLIWDEGYAAGRLCSHVFPDVPECLRQWAANGLDVRIYSSGSVHAQRVFFAHTEAGNLLPYLRGHYDTTTGPKRTAASYSAIVRDMGQPAESVLFLSDVPAELDAACEAGLRTGLVIRPGNAPVPDSCNHPRITSFTEIRLLA